MLPQGTSGLEERLTEMFVVLKRKLREDPSFRTPMTSFISSFEKIKTDSSLCSALSTFNKGPVAKTRQHQRPKGYLQTRAQIGVQPTAVARRKSALGGRRALITGRPTKASMREHPYNKTGKKKSAPHCLAHCVEAIMSLGGTH